MAKSGSPSSGLSAVQLDREGPPPAGPSRVLSPSCPGRIVPAEYGSTLRLGTWRTHPPEGRAAAAAAGPWTRPHAAEASGRDPDGDPHCGRRASSKDRGGRPRVRARRWRSAEKERSAPGHPEHHGHARCDGPVRENRTYRANGSYARIEASRDRGRIGPPRRGAHGRPAGAAADGGARLTSGAAFGSPPVPPYRIDRGRWKREDQLLLGVDGEEMSRFWSRMSSEGRGGAVAGGSSTLIGRASRTGSAPAPDHPAPARARGRFRAKGATMRSWCKNPEVAPTRSADRGPCDSSAATFPECAFGLRCIREAASCASPRWARGCGGRGLLLRLDVGHRLLVERARGLLG